MTSQYEDHEKALTNIIHNNVKPMHSDAKLNLTIYYKTMRNASLIMNSCLPPTSPLQEVNVA